MIFVKLLDQQVKPGFSIVEWGEFKRVIVVAQLNAGFGTFLSELI